MVLLGGVIRTLAPFGRVRDLGVDQATLGRSRDPSLRLKNGCGQDDADGNLDYTTAGLKPGLTRLRT